MTACKDSRGIAPGKRALGATLAGALAAGMVPAAALAAEQPEADGIEALVASDAFAGADAATITGGTADITVTAGKAETTLENVKGKALAVSEVKLFDGTPANTINTTDTAKYKTTVADASGAAVKNAKISAAGDYTVTVEALSGDYKGQKAVFKLTVKGAELKSPAVGTVDADGKFTAGLTYTGSAVEAAFQVGGKTTLVEGEDYTVAWKDAKGNDLAGAPTDAGHYQAVLTGAGDYAGQKEPIPDVEVQKITITAGTNVKASVTTDAAALPGVESVIGTDGEALVPEAVLSQVQLKLPAGKNTFSKNEAYTCDIVLVDEDNENVVVHSTPGATSGDPATPDTVTVKKVGKLATYKYAGKSLSDGDTVTVAESGKGVSWSEANLAVYNGTEDVEKGTGDDKYDVTYEKKNGDNWVASSLAAITGADSAGTYRVTVKAGVDNAGTSYDFGGTVSFVVKVAAGSIDADASVYVSYDGAYVSSIEKTYDGTAIAKPEVKAYSVDANGKKTDVSGAISAKYLDADGKEVKGGYADIKDAGSYTMVLSSDTYELTGDVTVPITIGKLDLSDLKVSTIADEGGWVMKASDTEGMFEWGGAEYMLDGTVVDKLRVFYNTGEALKKGQKLDGCEDGVGYDTLLDADWKANIPTGDVLNYQFQVYNEKTGEWDLLADVTETEVGNQAKFVEGNKYRLVLSVAEDRAGNYELSGDGETVVEFECHAKDEFRFADVTPAHWSFDQVAKAAKNKYMTGYANSKLFGPDDELTRAQAAQVLYNMSGADAEDMAPEGTYDNTKGWLTGFSDVDGSVWYGEAIWWAEETKIVTGYGDGTFRPDAPVTREEFAVMLARYAKAFNIAKTTGEGSMDDMSDAADVNTWALEGVTWAVENEYMGANGWIAPQATIARAEVAKMAVLCQPKAFPKAPTA